MSLCPHFLPDYFTKVHDVLVAFQSQISEIPFSEISSRLVARKVITEQDYYKILLLDSNGLQMEQLVDIISKRIRAFECFILVLMEENCNPWLAEELYNAYLRHVVSPIKQLKSSKKCECPQQTNDDPFLNAVAIVKDKLTYVAGKVDNCLYNVGTCMGFMDQTLYPTKNLLEPINRMLPFLKRNWKLDPSSAIEEQKPPILMSSLQDEDMNSKKLEPASVQEPTIPYLQIQEVVTNLHATPPPQRDASIESIDQSNLTENELNVIPNNPNAIIDNVPFNLGLLDLEWDNYDLIIENNKIDPIQTSDSNKASNNDLKISNQKIKPQPKKVSNGISSHTKYGVQNPKNISPTTTPQRNKKSPTRPFNTTSKPRLSPSDYVSIQKSIEWCNKRQN